MRLINPSFEILEQEEGLEGVYKQIEKVGRTCYKSEDKIAEGTAKPFVDRMIKSGHGAMLEHGTLYFKIPCNIDVAANFLDETSTWTKCKHIVCSEGNWWAITTNFRVMVEHFAPEYIEELIEKYLCEPTEYHVKRITVKFVTDQGILREFTRHRVFSFAVESTRYCNYSKKDKFNSEITFINPCWYSTSLEYNTFKAALIDAENRYMKLIEAGWTPQQARNVLPLATKCDMVMTGFVDDWLHFFDLRAKGTTGAPHPQALELAVPLYGKFVEKGLISL